MQTSPRSSKTRSPRLDLDLDKRLNCSDEEKKECYALVETLVALAETARRKGLLSLEEGLPELNPFFLRLGLQLIVDGTDPEVVDGILSNHICTSKLEGKDLLSRLLMREGVLAIQMGDNPRIMKVKLLSYFGEEFASSIVDDPTDALEKYYSEIKPQLPVSDDTMLLEEEVGILDDKSIQKVLQQLDHYVLASAMLGASGGIRIKVFRNISKRAATILKEDLDDPEGRSHEEIVEAQQMIVEIINTLRESGEIF